MNNSFVTKECQALLPVLRQLAPEYARFTMLYSGGFACAISGIHRNTQSRAVFKILRREHIGKWDLVERFTIIEREACRRYGGLLGQIDDLNSQPPFYCNVLKYVPGEQLRRFIDTQRRSTRERLHLFMNLARCVAKIHRLNIAHRDLNPNNVLVDGLNADVIDFGSAKLTDRKEDRTRAVEASSDKRLIIAQAQFAAPEILQSLSYGTMRSDVYSLGMLGYYILTNTYPYVIDFETTHDEHFARARDVAEKALRQFKSSRTFNPDVPEAVDLILKACLQFSPDDRLYSGERVVEVLEKADKKGRLGITPSSDDSSPGGDSRRPTSEELETEELDIKDIEHSALIVLARTAGGAPARYELTEPQATIGFGETVTVDLSPLVPTPPMDGALLSFTTIGRKLILKHLPGADTGELSVTVNGEDLPPRHQRYIYEGFSLHVSGVILEFTPPWTGVQLHCDTAIPKE